MTFRKILCPVDFSEPSREALTAAARLAADAAAELTLVYVWQSPVRLSEEALMQTDLLEHERKQAETSLAKWKAEAESVGAKSVTIKVLAGLPWRMIVDEVASTPGYDLVVLGTHGRSGIMRILLGSVAERVARHADCPVLLVRRRTAR
jgi:nucleotide-binding universal stress UspA family protein